MSVRLRLLDEVSFDGRAVTGERSHALLAALAGAQGRPVADPRLVEAVWGDDRPGRPGKALQVVVSRTRGQTERAAVALAERGYRLGLSSGEVDATRQGELVGSAQQAERRGDLVAARDTARAALALAVAGPGREPPPVEDLRAAGRAGRRTALAVLGRCASALGEHAVTDLDPGPVDLDEPTLAALLRSEAALHGAPAALTRYERHREDLRERLGGGRRPPPPSVAHPGSARPCTCLYGHAHGHVHHPGRRRRRQRLRRR